MADYAIKFHAIKKKKKVPDSKGILIDLTQVMNTQSEGSLQHVQSTMVSNI